MERSLYGYRVDDLCIDLQRQRVVRGGVPVPMPPLSFDLLLVLIRSAPALVSVDTLMERVWTGLVVTPETVTQRVKLLRDALGDDSRHPRYIVGVRGRGYRVLPAVQLSSEEPGTSLLPSTDATTLSGVNAAPPRAAARYGAPVIAVSLLVLVAAVLIVNAWPLGPSPNADSSSPEAQELYLEALLVREDSFSMGVSADRLQLMQDLLDQAITLDPDFAAAYAERAVIHQAWFYTNRKPVASELQLAEADLATGRRLAPDNAKVLGAGGVYLTLIEHDYEKAIAAFDAATARGLSDPIWLLVYSWALTRSGNREGAGAVLQKALALDHSNAILQANYIHHLLRGNQQERAWDQLDFYQQQNPAATTFQRLRAEMLFLVAANAKPWREQTAGTGYQHGVVTATNADDIALYQRFYWSRLDGEYGDMLSVLDAYPRNEVRSIVPASGLHPLAHYKGWLHLLEGDLRAAGRDGADIEDFLATNKTLPQHQSFHRLLAAEAALFSGDSERALALVEELSAELSAGHPLHYWLPAIEAWAGAHEAATTRLRRMARTTPIELYPGMILLDPLFSAPLETYPGFQALRAELEANIRASSYLHRESGV